MGRRRTERLFTQRYVDGATANGPDELIVEEPLEIRLDDALVSTTMRTPGNDFELAVGLCHTEGLLAGAPVLSARYCGTGSAVETEFNVVSVDTGGAAPVPTPRLAPTTSSCGLCGRDSIDALVERLEPLDDATAWSLAVLTEVPARMREKQELFGATGAVHAAASFTPDGAPVLLREDIGRHNAVDKVVGRMLLDGELPARGLGLYVSGRASFEMVQKAWAAGFSALLAVSAPSALAVETARRAGLLLAGFAREGRLNVYSPDPLRGG
jgi:FdhD protein